MARWKVATAAGTRTDGRTDGRPASGELLFFLPAVAVARGRTVESLSARVI